MMLAKFFIDILELSDVKSHCPWCRFEQYETSAIGSATYSHYCCLFEKPLDRPRDRFNDVHSKRLPECLNLRCKLQKAKKETL